jgi:hypothetical protein
VPPFYHSVTQALHSIAEALDQEAISRLVYLLSVIHPVEAEPLRQALRTVAEHRHHEVRPLGPLLTFTLTAADRRGL